MATSLAKISIKDSSSWNSFLDLIYPIGSLYFSSNSTSPGSKFGGTWAALNDGRYLRLNSWSSGGNNTMTVDQMPSHNHGLNGDVLAVGKDSTYVHATTAYNPYWFVHRVYTSANTGGGQPFYPLYRSVYCWYRTA